MSAEKLLKVVLLCALPASGKSEARKYLETRSPDECRNRFHMGATVQLDDYPYVDLMRRIDEELTKLNEPGVFFNSGASGFKEDYDWGALIHLINEDFEDLVNHNVEPPKETPGDWVLNRLDKAREAVTGKKAFAAWTPEVFAKISKSIEETAATWLKKKIEWIPDTLEGRTVVIEFARGGPEGSKFPLPEPFGYEYTLKQFSHKILDQAAILYIWVTPEQSRQKNIDRGHSDDPSKREISHSVPETVMRQAYGCDDMNYLAEKSDLPATVEVFRDGKKYVLPVGIFDNHVEDLTSFARADEKTWKAEDVEKIAKAMNAAFSGLVEQYLKLK